MLAENPLRGQVRLATGVLLFGGAGEDRAEDGEQEDVGAGEWAELRFAGGPKAGDDDGKLAAGEQGHSGSEAGWPVHSSAVSGPVTREDFRKPGDNGEQESDPQDRRQTCRVNLKAEEEKERRSRSARSLPPMALPTSTEEEYPVEVHS